MSYVDLKHLLADLALEAVRNPSQATWVGPLAAYAAAATPQEPAVRLRQSKGITRLVRAGLLEYRNGRVCCRRVFEPHLTYLKKQSARLDAAVRSLTSSAAPAGVPEDLVLGAALFNAGLYFEAHELLEGTWRKADSPQRDFYHGIVQAAAALYHFEKKNLHGTRTLLAKSMRRLAPYPSPYLGVDVARFRDRLAAWQASLTDPPPPPPILQFSASRGE